MGNCWQSSLANNRGVIGPISTTKIFIYQVSWKSCTTSEKEIGLLLIAVFRQFINLQSYEYMGSIIGGLTCNSGSVSISHFSQSGRLKSIRKDF